MSQKLKKHSVLIIAAVLLVAMAFVGAASADVGKFAWSDDFKVVTFMSGSDGSNVLDKDTVKAALALQIKEMGTSIPFTAIIGGTLETIGDSAFEYCDSLEAADLKNAKTIGVNAFNASGLTTVCMKKVETIGDSAFGNCTSLRFVLVSYYGSLAEYTVHQHIGPEKLSFPTTLKSIGNRSFYGCTNLCHKSNVNRDCIQIEIPEGTLSIGNESFYDCYNIPSITVPSTVTQIGENAFNTTKVGYDYKTFCYCIIYDQTGGKVTNSTFNNKTNVAAILVDPNTMEYKFVGDHVDGYPLVRDFGSVVNQPVAKPNQILCAPTFLGWSKIPGDCSDPVKNTNQALINETGKYTYLYQVWNDSRIHTMQQVYDADGKPIPGFYVDRNGDGQIDWNDGYKYKFYLEYGVTEFPLPYTPNSITGYQLWALKYNGTSKAIEKYADLLQSPDLLPFSTASLKPNVVVEYEDGTVVRYTDSQGRYVYNGSDPYFGTLYTDYAIVAEDTPITSSSQTGSTIIRQEGQVVVNQEPTVTPTATPTPTPTPTQVPATPTIISTAKPTTQPTQQSPAPFVGLIAGLGAAALVLGRLRR